MESDLSTCTMGTDLRGSVVERGSRRDPSTRFRGVAYKDLTEIERSFRELKDLVEMRPIYHRRPQQVRAHIFVAALAFLLARALEKKLKAAGVPMSVDIRVGAETRRGVTGGNHEARQIPAALQSAIVSPNVLKSV